MPPLNRPAIIRDAPRRVIVKPVKKTTPDPGAANPFARKKYGNPTPIKRDSTDLPPATSSVELPKQA